MDSNLSSKRLSRYRSSFLAVVGWQSPLDVSLSLGYQSSVAAETVGQGVVVFVHGVCIIADEDETSVRVTEKEAEAANDNKRHTSWSQVWLPRREGMCRGGDPIHS